MAVLARIASSFVAFASVALPLAAADLPQPATLAAAGASFPVIESGTGAPVIFVHGAVSDYRAFAVEWPAVAEGHRAIAYTQRWFGTGEWPADQPFSSQVHADDLVAILGTLGEPAHVVAWSYGADVALRAAIAAPDRVRSLVLYEPPMFGLLFDSEKGEGAFNDLMSAFGATDAAVETGDDAGAARSLVEAVYGLPEGGFATLPQDRQSMALDSAKTVAMYWSALETATPLTCEDLSTIETPTLVVKGAQTLPAFALAANATADCMPAADVMVLDGVGHDGPIRAGEPLSQSIIAFVDAH